MGVYIPNMDMPTRCFNCGMCEVDDTQILCCISHGSYVEYRELDEKIAIQDRPSWCPLIEVPPHGRLIDADVFIAKEEKVYCTNCDMRKNSKGKVVYDIGDAPCRACRRRDTLDDLDSVTTIIEAEEGE